MKARYSLAWLLGAALTLTSWAGFAAEPAPAYRVTKQVALGAPDRWDYVFYDAPTHRVYVAHADRVTVVDGQRGVVLGEISGYPGGTHGVVIVHSVGLGYTDDGQAGQAGAFDLKTLQTVKRIHGEQDADAIAFDPSSGHVFVVNGDPGTLTVIDPKQNAAIGSVSTGEKLEFLVADGRGKLYVNGAEKSDIVRIDTALNRVDAHWPIPSCASPHGLAIDVESRRLFSSCVNNRLVVVDADSGALVAQLPIGSGTDAAAFDPKRKLIFSSNGRDGTLSVIREINPATFVSLGSVPTAVSARTMAIDPGTGRIFLAAAEVDKSSPASTLAAAPGRSPARARLAIIPGSLKLLFLDPPPDLH